MNVPKKVIVLAICGLTLTVSSGILHGFMSQRWVTDKRLEEAAARLAAFPATVGSWELQSEKPLSSNAVKMLQCAGYFNRIYIHSKTNHRINVTVMVGPGATLAVHTPEICYESRNYKLLGTKRSLELADTKNDRQNLWSVDFEANDVGGQNLRVHYGWSKGGPWMAPDQPRFAFAGERVLFKIQVAEFVHPFESNGPGQASEFLSEFIPALQRYLLTPPRNNG